MVASSRDYNSYQCAHDYKFISEVELSDYIREFLLSSWNASVSDYIRNSYFQVEIQVLPPKGGLNMLKSREVRNANSQVKRILNLTHKKTIIDRWSKQPEHNKEPMIKILDSYWS